MLASDKIVTFQEIEKIKKKCESENKSIVFTNGCFDILHIGHIKLLEFCKSQGDYVIIGLNSDKSVKRLKGDSRPINSQEERMEILEIPSHKFYLGVQFHPEFNSRPGFPEESFAAFINAAAEK